MKGRKKENAGGKEGELGINIDQVCDIPGPIFLYVWTDLFQCLIPMAALWDRSH